MEYRKILLGISIFLSGCSLLSPVKTPNVTSYMLSCMPVVIDKKTSGKSIYVNQITVNPIYNTTKMAYVKSPYQLAFFVKNAWVGKPGQMLQPLIVKTLHDTRYFRAVIAAPSIAQHDYTLTTELVQLQQIFFEHHSCLRLEIRAQIMNANNKVVGTKDIIVTEPAYPMNPRGGAAAANRATAKALQILAKFSINTLDKQNRYKRTCPKPLAKEPTFEQSKMPPGPVEEVKVPVPDPIPPAPELKARISSTPGVESTPMEPPAVNAVPDNS